MEFASAGFPKGDLAEEKRNDELRNTSHWLTKSGFVPAKKLHNSAAYDRVHPKHPTDYRIDEFSLPYAEPAAVNRFLKRDAGPNPFPDRSDFKVTAHNLPPHFGPKDYFKSVHLSGTGLMKEREEAIRQEQELWKSKVIVDSTIFHVDKSNHPTQADRWKPLLRDPPMKKSLVATHVDGTGPSMMLAEPYGRSPTSPTRPSTDPLPTRAHDFKLYGTQHYDKSSLNHLSRPKHTPRDSSD